MSDNDVPVVDDTAHSRFVVEQEGRIAHLVYRAGGGQLVLTHTEVPATLGGRGIGGRLVRAAAERAAREGLTVSPWCSYARKWLEDHPDVAEEITIDWTSPPQGRRP